MATKEARVLLEGLVFPECLRWYDGKIWFSDMHAHQVMTIDLEGKTEVIVKVPGQPAGLGWLPDGRLLVVSMTDKRLLRLEANGLAQVADLGKLASGTCNDMVVDSQGRAYIGHYQGVAPADIIMVKPDGDAHVVADSLIFPNGAVITPDRKTLIVAETLGSCLTAFNIESDGSLSERRVWARLGKAVYPDGICLDAEGAVWVANARVNEVIRVSEGGELTHRIKVSTRAFACMLGGVDRRTLYIATAETSNPQEAQARRSGRLETIQVDVPGAGLP